MTKAKAVELNVSLDDLIVKEKKKSKAKNVGKKVAQNATGPPKDVDYSSFSDDQIRAQLSSRGLSTKGQRPKLVNRLKAEVQRAWGLWRKANKAKSQQQQLFPDSPNPPKKKLSEEERSAIHAKNEANRLAKAKRRAENFKKQEENKRRKRQKREESAAKQAEMKVQQKLEKENRQRCEVYVQFDIEKYKQDLRKKLDPKGDQITNISRDFSKKGFIVKFANAAAAAKCAKGSTMKAEKKITSKLTAKILPSPVESKCVFFQYPLEEKHPSKEKAEQWTLTQNEDPKLNELKRLAIWIDSAYKEFSKFGKIVNIFRERGFIVVNFVEEKSAEKCLTEMEGKEFNGCSLNFFRAGTPTKADRLECLKELESAE